LLTSPPTKREGKGNIESSASGDVGKGERRGNQFRFCSSEKKFRRYRIYGKEEGNDCPPRQKRGTSCEQAHLLADRDLKRGATQEQNSKKKPLCRKEKKKETGTGGRHGSVSRTNWTIDKGHCKPQNAASNGEKSKIHAQRVKPWVQGRSKERYPPGTRKQGTLSLPRECQKRSHLRSRRKGKERRELVSIR